MQANKTTMRIVYGSKNPKVLIDGREKTCYFHWTQSLEKLYIKHNLQDQHKHLYIYYRDSSSTLEAKTRYLAIKASWILPNYILKFG